MSKIEWTDKTWNPITGCSKVSIGCTHCYAKRMAKRLKGRYGYPEDNPFAVTFHKDKLAQPLNLKKPCNIFVCSMGDLFHADVEFERLNEIFSVMRIAKQPKQHRYFILTKRPDRMRKLLPRLMKKKTYSHHIFYGVSAENQKLADARLKILCNIDGRRFISLEPLLAPVNLSRAHLSCLDWVIAGSESGAKARPSEIEWFYSIKNQCAEAGVPFFFKQFVPQQQKWCGHKIVGRMEKKISMPKLDGKIWNQMPELN